MLAELEPIISSATSQNYFELPDFLLAGKTESFSIESFQTYIEPEAGLVQKKDLAEALMPLWLLPCANLVATLGGFNWLRLRTELLPLQLDVLNRATKDATLFLAYDTDHLTLTLNVPKLVKPSKNEFYVTCENEIVNIVWSRGAARYLWTEPVPLGKKIAMEPEFDLDIAPGIQKTQCTFSFAA